MLLEVDMITDRLVSESEFEKFILLPEHGDTLFELIDRQIYPVLPNNRSSRIAMSIGIRIGAFVNQHELGYITGADGGYQVSGQRYIPDVAFMSKARQAEASDMAYNPLAPDLAVEVLSPTDNPANVRIKLINYLNAGTVVWIVDPAVESVEIYIPNEQPMRLGVDDTIKGGDILPNFELAVKDIFK